MTTPKRIVILGAAGRDFHNFNVRYRDDPESTVVAFTAAQIPGIAGRRFPASLAGPRYPTAYPSTTRRAWRPSAGEHRVTDVVFAYSDVTHEHVMHLASRALAGGADFLLLGPQAHDARGGSAGHRGLGACAPAAASRRSRAGSARACARAAVASRCCAIRCPTATSPRSACSASRRAADLDAAQCTIEEREEYEPHLAAGNLVFAGRRLRGAIVTRRRRRGRHHRLGRRQQRLPVRPARPAYRASSTRCARTARGTTPARRCCAWRTSLSSTRWTRPRRRCGARDRDVRARQPARAIVRAASPVRLDDPARVRGASRAGGRRRPDHHPRRHAVRRRLRRRDRGRRGVHRRSRARSAPPASPRCSPTIRTSGRCCRPLGYTPGATRGAARDHRRRRRRRRDRGDADRPRRADLDSTSRSSAPATSSPKPASPRSAPWSTRSCPGSRWLADPRSRGAAVMREDLVEHGLDRLHVMRECRTRPRRGRGAASPIASPPRRVRRAAPRSRPPARRGRVAAQRVPVSPSTTITRGPPSRGAMIGRRIAMASISTRPNGSRSDACSTTSIASTHAATSRREPVRMTWPARSGSAMRARSCAA